jgi:hypothetical protein
VPIFRWLASRGHLDAKQSKHDRKFIMVAHVALDCGHTRLLQWVRNEYTRAERELPRGWPAEANDDICQGAL